MSIRISRQHLDSLVDRLNREVPGQDYSIEVAYGSPKLVRKDGSVSVSPRLAKGQLYVWMHAFLDGIEAGRMAPAADDGFRRGPMIDHGLA
jgi:hypothetical protein